MELDQPKYSLIVDCIIGKDTKIYDHVNLYKCIIGENCKIDSYVYIEENVRIGDNTKVRPFTFIPTGVTIGKNVFIGPNVTFTNDKYPKVGEKWEQCNTTVEDFVSIGAGAVILPGITLGHHSLIGAGSVVTKTVPPHSTVILNTKYLKKNGKGSDGHILL